MANTEQFQAVFEQLRGILQPYEAHLKLDADTPESYSLNTPYVEQWQKELFFGAAQIKKNYVSFYLMPVYVFPALLDNISPALKKRMQGKSCFNFKMVEQELFNELVQLTGRGFETFKQEYQF
jgi:hypothetical protein